MNRSDFFNAMQAEGLLNPEDFNLRAKNADLFAQTVGCLVKVGYEIEGDTVSTADTVRLLAPGPHVDIWEGQELWHSLLYAETAFENGIVLPELAYSPPEKYIHRLGKIVEHSDMMTQLFGQVVDIEGFKNERQNMAAQHRAVRLLHGIEELELARMFSAMYRQEAFHAGFYWEDLKERRTKHPLLYGVAKRITSRDPKPIGANTPERVIRVGAVMKEMFETEELKQLVDQTAKVLDFSVRQIQKQQVAIAECVLAYEETAA